MKKTLIVCMLTLLSVGLALGANVTFNVNMSAQIDEGNFDPANDTLDVAGSFNGWAGGDELSDADNDSIYTGTFAIDPDTIEYKFRMLSGSTTWESVPNREYIVEGDAVLDTVWFDDYNPNALVDAEIYFYVDMNIQLLNENFEPDSGDIVIVRGAFNGWSGEAHQLTEDPSVGGLYVNSFEMDDVSLDAASEFKYVIHKADGSDMWESSDNRSYMIPTGHSYTDSDGDGYVEVPTDTVFFSNIGWEDIIQQDVTVYFTCDITSAINALNAGEILIDSQTDADTISSVDEIQAVYVNGLLGNWWDWGNNPEDYRMYDDGTHGDETADDYVFTRGITLTAGQAKTQVYKYGINSLDNEAGFAENREMVIDDASATFYPEADCFGSQNTDERLPFPEYTCETITTVTFQVNMSAQISLDNFDPASDFVDVAGTINAWAGGDTLYDADGDSVYQTTLEVEPDTIEYKYRINGSWDTSESISNRVFIVEEGQNIIPTVWYNDFDPNAIVDAEVYFYADMNIQLLNENFEPDSGDIVVVRGAFNGWAGEAHQLTEDPSVGGLYVNSFEMDDVSLDVASEFKYVIHKADGSDMWESSDNHSFMIPTDHSYTDSDGDGYIEVPTDTVFFSNIGWDDIIQQDVTVYFTCDISSAISALNAGKVLIDSQTDADTISSVDEIQAVYVNGLLGNWWDWGANPEDYQMYDDGTHGDETAEDHIFTRGITLTAGQAKNQVYKYGLNSLDNEAGFAENREVVIDDASATYYPETDCFGSQNTDERLPFPEYGCEGSAVDEDLYAVPDKYILHQNYPNPFNPTTTIVFEMPEKHVVKLEIYNLLGRKVKTLYSGRLNAGPHAYQWNGLNEAGKKLSSGIYIYRLSGDNVSLQKKMLFMK